MEFVDPLNARDQSLATSLADFLPEEIYDIHAHGHHPGHFTPGTWRWLNGMNPQGCREHRASLQRYLPARTMHGLHFGLPHKTADRAAINAWMDSEVRQHGTPLSRALMLVSPTDDRDRVAGELRSGRFCGIKPYHCYASRPDTMNATVEEYAPEWMWELLNEVRGCLMLHIVRDEAIADPDNQRSLRRLCRSYPRARLILAHIARSFNYRNARSGLHAIADLDNAVVDTSAIAEADAFRSALKILGPRRVLWGSDFPVSELRGRCVTTGSLFFWLQPEVIRPEHQTPTNSGMTLVGIESLLCLKEACADFGLTRSDMQDIFLNNALRTLAPHLPPAETAAKTTETSL